MDIYDRAAAWATVFVMENELITGFAAFAGQYVDADTVKFLASVANLIVPQIVEHLDPALEGAYEEIVSDLTESLADYAIDLGAEFTGMKADAKRASAAIEELTVELDEVMKQEPGEFRQEIANLEREFADEQKQRMDQLDTIENAWFENRPGLDQNQREAAEERFEEIRTEEMDSLGSRQDARLEELVRFQQERRDDSEERKKELDGTRDERS
jgi:hypothetical protein